MTLEEAFQELAVDRSASADAVRRAYLRLLKAHKPESDPQGFRRLREAFELARASGAPGVVFGAIPGQVVTHPAEPLRTDPDPDAVATATTPSQPDPPDAAPPLDFTFAHDVVRMDAEGEPESAAEALTELFAQAARRSDVALPSPTFTLDLLLRLHQSASLGPARRLHEGFRTWLAGTGDEVRLLSGLLTVQWAACDELHAMTTHLSRPARAIVARAARTGDLVAARAALAELRTRHPWAADADAACLRLRRGGLGEHLAQSLSPRDAGPAAQAGSRRGIGGARAFSLLVVVIVIVLQVSFALTDYPSSKLGVVAERRGREAEVLRDHLRPLAQRALDLAAEEADAGLVTVARLAAEVAVALDAAECPTATRRAHDLSDFTPREAASRPEVEQLVIAVYDKCGSPPNSSGVSR